MKIQKFIAFLISIFYSFHLYSYDCKIELYRKGKRWYFVDSGFNRVNSHNYDSIAPGFNSFYIVMRGEKFALFDSIGQAVTRFDYSSMSPYSSLNNEYLCIKNGQDVILNGEGLESPYEFPSIYGSCVREFFVVPTFLFEEVAGGYLIQNRNLDIFHKIQDSLSIFKPYEKIIDNFNGTAFVKENGKWRVIDSAFNDVLEVQFDSIGKKLEYGYGVGSNEYLIYNGGLVGLIDSTNKIVLPIKYKKIKHVDSDYIWVLRNTNKYGWFRRRDGVELFE